MSVDYVEPRREVPEAERVLAKLPKSPKTSEVSSATH